MQLNKDVDACSADIHVNTLLNAGCDCYSRLTVSRPSHSSWCLFFVDDDDDDNVSRCHRRDNEWSGHFLLADYSAKPTVRRGAAKDNGSQRRQPLACQDRDDNN